jgi:hypothetical protein
MKMAELPVGIHGSDVLHILKGEGYDVKPWRLRAATLAGRIPKPFKTTSGEKAWKADDLPAICSYFENPVKPGRPKQSPT